MRLAHERRYATAFPFLAHAARCGYVHAIYALATWHLFGRYVRKDLAAGARWLRKAAATGHPAACYDLAVSYEKGHSVRKNLRKALSLYTQAAIAGDAEASLEVARMHYWGIGMQKRNIKRAREFYLRAARAKIPEAEYCLGVIYEQGDGVPQNRSAAKRWYRRAALDQGEFGAEARKALRELGTSP